MLRELWQNHGWSLHPSLPSQVHIDLSDVLFLEINGAGRDMNVVEALSTFLKEDSSVLRKLKASFSLNLPSSFSGALALLLHLAIPINRSGIGAKAA